MRSGHKLAAVLLVFAGAIASCTPAPDSSLAEAESGSHVEKNIVENPGEPEIRISMPGSIMRSANFSSAADLGTSEPYPAGEWVKVVNVDVDDTLNIRAEASHKALITGRLSPGQSGVRWTGNKKSVGTQSWYELSAFGQMGWANSAYLEIDGDYKPTVANGRRVALVIGNSAYGGALPPLPNPVKDASAVAEVLKGLGYEVELLLNADTNDLSKAMETFGKSEDVKQLIFYYAGHGISVADESFLVPVDNDNSIVDGPSLLSALVPLKAVFSYASKNEATPKLIFVDACRNSLELIERLQKASITTASAGLSKTAPPRQSVVVFSTDPGNVASDGTGDNSPFTTALLQRFQEPQVEIKELVRRVRMDVLKATDAAQSPWVEDSMADETFIIPPINVDMSMFVGRYFGYSPVGNDAAWGAVFPDHIEDCNLGYKTECRYFPGRFEECVGGTSTSLGRMNAADVRKMITSSNGGADPIYQSDSSNPVSVGNFLWEPLMVVDQDIPFMKFECERPDDEFDTPTYLFLNPSVSEVYLVYPFGEPYGLFLGKSPQTR